MPAPSEIGTAVNVTATGQLGRVATPVKLLGFYVNSTTAGTIVLADASGGNAYSGTITPAVGWHQFPLDAPAGLHATIGGTLNVTFFLA